MGWEIRNGNRWDSRQPAVLRALSVARLVELKQWHDAKVKGGITCLKYLLKWNVMRISEGRNKNKCV